MLGGSLAFARRRPLAVWLVATTALLVTVPHGVLELPAYLLVPAHAFCAGRWDSRWSGLAGTLALIAASELGVLVDHDSAVPYAFTPAAAWGAGCALREREQVAARLIERTRELESEREDHARLSVRYERARIAAELHDIVAHALSVIVVQAGAGQRLAAIDAEVTADTFQSIAGAAHQAEQDVARLAELLADEGTSDAPDVGLIEELVARAAGGGLHVTLRLEGERERLPAEMGRVAYRVAQEGLTNALRHAPGAPVTVLVRRDATQLVVAVTNSAATRESTLAGAGTGHGLRGLRERASACGGTLDAAPTPDGGWRVVARLPISVAATRAG